MNWQAGLPIFFGIAVYYFVYSDKPDESFLTTKRVQEEYDYVIVGGGSAGAVVASRLSEDEHLEVLLLEAGGSYEEEPNIHVPVTFLNLLKTELDWLYFSEPQTHALRGFNGKSMYMPRGKVLGGTSAINGMQFTRGSSFDYDEWERTGCTGWSYKDVLPYFKKLEDVQVVDLQTSKFRGKGGPIVVSENTGSSMTEHYLKAGQEIGFDVQDYNGEYQEGFSKVQHSINKGERCSTGLVYLGKIGKRKNLDIAVHSFVTKLDIKKGKATGVFYIKNGKKHFVRARKEIIVSAGAINTPQLLMLSGIGPKSHLTELGIPVVADLPVGEDFQDHIMAVLPASISKPYSVTAKSLNSWWNRLQYKFFGTGPWAFPVLDGSAFLHVDKSKSKKTYPDAQWIIFSTLFLAADQLYNYKDEVASELLATDPNSYGFVTIIAPTHSKSRGNLKLRSTDPFDYPKIDPKYLSAKEDIEVLISAIRQWEAFIETPTMKALGADISRLEVSFCSHHKFRSDAFWECLIRHTASTEYHHTSTCKMGAITDTKAVLDPQLRVKGIQGLRVVDASVFPNVTSGNTNIPVVMVAEKAADMIRGVDTVKHLRE